jgi:acyl-CoA synthetase (AMP-forming)/AMP-acid ligase II
MQATMQNTLLTLFSSARSEEHYRNGFWKNDTLYSLLQAHARKTPDKIAIRTLRRPITYSELMRQVDLFASELLACRVRRGQRVAVWLPSSIETVVALLACSRNGFICCPSLHRDHTVEEALILLTRVRARALVARAGYGANGSDRDVFSTSKQVESLTEIFAVGDDGIVGTRRNANLTFSPAAEFDPDRVVYIGFTSGTTGIPKGVMHTDNTLLANARSLVGDWDINDNSVIYTLSPLSHNLGFGTIIMTLAAGAELVLHDLPKGSSVLERLFETNTTFLVGVPTHAIDLVAELKSSKLPRPYRLKGFRISGAAVPPDVIRELLAFGVLPQSGYGMTETCSHQYTLPNDDPKLIIDSCGRACPGYEIKIFDSENLDRELPPGEVGQIGGRGASLMLGYFDDQAATEDSFNAAGWFMTGDLGWVDERGYLRITGRKKDVINRGGRKIFPGKIEALASKHNAIHKAAAIPVPDRRLGEKVCLAVVFQPGLKASPADVLKHLNESGLSKHDMPEYFLEIKEMPLTASGKIKKREIAEWVAEGRLVPQPVC